MNHRCRVWPAMTMDPQWHRRQHHPGQWLQSRTESRPVQLHPLFNKGKLMTSMPRRTQGCHATLCQQESEAGWHAHPTCNGCNHCTVRDLSRHNNHCLLCKEWSNWCIPNENGPVGHVLVQAYKCMCQAYSGLVPINQMNACAGDNSWKKMILMLCRRP